MCDKENNSIVLSRLQKLISGKKSRTEIAKALNCDVSTITKHYNGQRAVTTDYLIKYAKYFNVSADYLTGLSDVPNYDITIKEINNYIGLSDLSIEALHCLNSANDSLLHTIDVLLEDLYYSLDLSADVHEKLMNNPFRTAKEFGDRSAQYIEEAIATKKLHKFSNTLKRIHDYLTSETVEFENKYMFTHDTLLKIVQNTKNFPAVISEEDFNRIVQRLLLDEIIDSLKLMKTIVQEGNSNGND